MTEIKTQYSPEPDIEHVAGFIPDATALLARLEKTLKRSKRFREEALGRRQAAYFGPSVSDVCPPETLPPKALRDMLRMTRSEEIRDNAMTDELAALCEAVADYTKVLPDTVLVSWYRDFDHVRYHSDPGLVLGPAAHDVVIPTLSLGAPRWFSFRKRGQPGECFGFDVRNGDLVVMRGTLQDRYEHALFPAPCPGPLRLSVTFITFPRDTWASRAHDGFQVVSFPDGIPTEPLFISRGTEGFCRNELRTMQLRSAQCALVLSPEMRPLIARFGRRVPKSTRVQVELWTKETS